MSKPKPSVPATTKALQAWQSELRRLEKRLEEWANDLAQREELLEQQETAFAEAVDGADGETLELYAEKFPPEGTQINDCGCTDEDVEEGCDCPKCERIRAQATAGNRQKREQNKPVEGDEVSWLENLWKLEDKRRKKHL